MQSLNAKEEVWNPAKLHKHLLTDFQGCSALCLGALDADGPSANVISESLTALRSLLQSQSELHSTRKGINASIGRCKKQSEPIDKHLAHVKALSVELKNLQQTITHHSDLLLGRLNAHCTAGVEKQLDTSQHATAPGQFLKHAALSDVRVEDVEIHVSLSPEAWNDYVNRHPAATHYHHYGWCDVLQESFRHQIYRIAAISNTGAVVGVMLALHLQSRVVEPRILSMPFVIYGGPLADTDAIADLMAEFVADLAPLHQCDLTELRETHPREGWRCSDDKVCMILQLPEKIVTLEKSLGSKVMAQVRRAVREKPTIAFGGVELLDEFYEVFSQKMRDHGTPVYSKSFFEKICAQFANSTELAVVRLNGKVVASAFTVRYRSAFEVPWAASLRSSDRLGMNMFLYHCLLTRAIEQQYRFFEFGRSSREGNTYRFKKQWGAAPFALYWNSRSTVNRSDNDVNQQSMKLDMAIALWKRLPVRVTNLIGPRVSGELPW